MRYQCIIVDNDPLDRDILSTLLQNTHDLEIIGVFENAMMASAFLQTNTVHIMFIEADMPDFSGIQLLKSLNQPPITILISKHAEHAVYAYNLNAIDFITKPIAPERLLRASVKAVDHLNLSKKVLTRQPAKDYIIFRTQTGMMKMNTSDIVYVGSMSNRTNVYLADDTNIVVYSTLDQLEQQLPSKQFMRIHRCYIINWDLAGVIQKNDIEVSGKYKIPIGNTYRKELASKIDVHVLRSQKID